MSVTFPKGFKASGVSAGLKTNGDKDLAIVLNTGPNFDAVAVFTTNQVKAAPVLWSQQVLKDNKIKSVVLNSGGANACTGPAGFSDTHKTAEYAANIMGSAPIEVAICSTGLIGLRLPIEKLLSGLDTAISDLSENGGMSAAEAILTTDTHAKTTTFEKSGWKIGAMIKGAGMLAPDLATMLCVITTDADLSNFDLEDMFHKCVDQTLNRVDSDGCTSTNDTVILMSSAASSIKPDKNEFESSLIQVLKELSKHLIEDAEGSTKVIEITVKNALTEHDAVEVARSVARNNLLKCALFGEDPNWGRILAAVGNAKVKLDPNKINVEINKKLVCENGSALTLTPEINLKNQNIQINIDLNIGGCEATVLTNDLSIKYVIENSAYST